MIGGRPTLYLHPGEVRVAEAPATLSTVVGSCIAVFLWDGVTKRGGMNHFLLPHPVGTQAASARFGTVAVAELLQQLSALGSGAGKLVARIFGGAHVAGIQARAGLTLGEENAALAARLLNAAAIPILSCEIGGTRGRRVVCDLEDGSTWTRTL